VFQNMKLERGILPTFGCCPLAGKNMECEKCVFKRLGDSPPDTDTILQETLTENALMRAEIQKLKQLLNVC